MGAKRKPREPPRVLRIGSMGRPLCLLDPVLPIVARLRRGRLNASDGEQLPDSVSYLVDAQPICRLKLPDRYLPLAFE